MPRRVVFTLVAVALLLATFLAPRTSVSSPAVPAAPTGWDVESVDEGRLFSGMTDRALRLDAAGNPHYVYGQEHLYHASYDGTSWAFEEADGAPGVGNGASLDIAADGTLHAAYLGSGSIRYARRDGAGWHAETAVLIASASASAASIAVDGSGEPHIVFVDGQLKHAHKDASGWHVETVDTATPSIEAGVSAAVDPAGAVHVAYAAGFQIKHAYLEGGAWLVDILDEVPVTVRTINWCSGIVSVSLAIDPDGYAKTSYLIGSGYQQLPTIARAVCSSEARLATNSLSGWSISKIAGWQISSGALWSPPYGSSTAGSVPRHASLSLGASGRTFVALTVKAVDTSQGFESFQLQIAHDEGQSWGLDSLDSQSDTRPSIAAQTSHPQIVYQTKDDPPALKWNKHFGDTYGVTGWQTSLFQTYATVVTLGRNLAIDGSGYPHLSYQRSGATDPQNLYYTYRDSKGWHQEIVDPLPGTGIASYLALTASGQPQVVYTAHSFETSTTSVKYAYRAPDGWHPVTLQSWTSSVSPVDQPSMAITSLGYPRIVYANGDGVAAVLTLAGLASNGWYSMTLPDHKGVNGSLRLDVIDHPRISFYDPATQTLKWAWGEVPVQAIPVDQTQGSGLSNSMVLSSSVGPSIVYSNMARHAICYATQYQGGWRTSVVEGNAASYLGPSAVSIALSGDDAPWVAHGAVSEGQGYVYFSYPTSPSTWSRMTIGPARVPSNVAIAVRNGTQPLVLFLGTDGEIKVATLNGPILPPLPTPTPIARLLLPIAARDWQGTPTSPLCGP